MTDQFEADLKLASTLYEAINKIDFSPYTFEQKQKLALAAVTLDGVAIVYLSKDQRTPPVCLAAVAQTGDAIQYLSKDNVTSMEKFVAGMKK